ncbi:MAG: hypothetical protein V3T05_08050 [Myxococcota bacterium]
MTLTLVCLTAAIIADPAGDASMAHSADELRPAEEMMESALPEKTKALEEDLERSKRRLRGRQPGEGGATGRGSHEVTGDWADDSRWKRYHKEKHSHSEHTHCGGRGTVDAEADGPWVGAKRPEFLRRRRPGMALALGGLIGFGAAHYYAGETKRGMIFSIVDVALVAGFLGTTVALNMLVIDHDFQLGLSLARGERHFGKRERQLYRTSVVLGVAILGSHVFQAVSGFSAAKRTNRTLKNFSFVPTGTGAMMQFDF